MRDHHSLEEDGSGGMGGSESTGDGDRFKTCFEATVDRIYCWAFVARGKEPSRKAGS